MVSTRALRLRVYGEIPAINREVRQSILRRGECRTHCPSVRHDANCLAADLKWLPRIRSVAWTIRDFGIVNDGLIYAMVSLLAHLFQAEDNMVLVDKDFMFKAVDCDGIVSRYIHVLVGGSCTLD